ncbi:MAG: hypothetical protein QHG99_03720 [Methanomicrobiales archaeon]|nr:hypothetical protein [Methanomicrobiales archaeon]
MRFWLGWVLVFLTVFSTACLGDLSRGEVKQGEMVKVAISDIEADWAPGLGCHYIVSGHIYSTSLDRRGALVLVSLLERETGSIRDTRAIPAYSLEDGGSIPFRVVLDGECRSYLVNAEVKE